MGLGNRIKKLFGSAKKEKNAYKEVNDDEKIVKDENKVSRPSKQDKIKSFKYLDDLIHSGMKEIVLDSDIILEDSESYEYSNGIKLDVDDIIIDGNGYAIDACGKTRIFICNSKNITIRNITLRNGYEKYEGGAIYNTGELTIKDSTLSNNLADRASMNVTKSSGGAIYNDGELSIVDSNVSNNTSKMEGGAIINMGNLNIINSTFSDNKTRYNGGAISNEGKLNIKDSTFSNNLAQDPSLASSGGGAIVNSGELILENSYLYHNGGNTGGAIRNGKYAKVFNCEISNNYGPRNIIINFDFLEIHNTILSNNSSKNIIENRKFNLSFFSCKFIGNTVEESVIYNSGKFLTISDSILENNLMHNYNVKNIINQTNLTLTNSKILDVGKSISNEGSILLKKSYQDIENKIEGSGDVEIYGENIPNTNKFDFGYLDKKIHESNTKEIILDQDICFEKYESDFYEGGIELDIDDLIIDGNGHTVDGACKSRIFLITGNNITLKNIVFKNGFIHKNYDNLQNNNGGAIKINHSNLMIKNCEFINNSTELGGGAIYNRGTLDISESSFSNNASAMGGAIYNDGELNINNSNLSQNNINATQEYNKGGAIDNNGLMNIYNCIFSENTVKGEQDYKTYYYGGAIYNNGELNILESLFKSNIVKKDGGAIYNDGGRLTISKSTLNKNVSIEKSCCGGAIYNNDGDLAIIESTLNENIAKGEFGNGGAIYNYEGDLTIIDSAFSKNTADMGGGTIYNDEGILILYELTINDDKAKYESLIYNNGRIFSKGDFFTNLEKSFTNVNDIYEFQSLKENQRDFTFLNELINSGNDEIKLEHDILLNLSNNELRKYKNGIEIDRNDLVIDGNGHSIDAQYFTQIFRITGSNVTIKNMTLRRGYVKENGGAIENNGELNIIESTFADNKAKHGNGGAIENNGELNIIESTFADNKAKHGNGGAINNESGMLNITKSSLNGNIAKYGGGIFNNKMLNIFESEFLKNEAEKSGAIHNRGELTITESALTENTASYGGAINNEGELNISGSLLNENTASDGGAMNNSGRLCIKESSFNKNIAEERGGAIYNYGVMIIYDITFKDNSAEYGGDIFNSGRIFSKGDCFQKLTRKSLLNNYNSNLGLIHELKSLKNKNKDFTFLNELINSGNDEIKLEHDILLNLSNNEEKTYKNGIEIDRNDFVIDGNGHSIDAQYFTRIFKITGSNVTIKNITLKNGYSEEGGAIYHEKGILTITESTLTGNTAGCGGAIYYGEGKLTISESSLNENSADTMGGAIFYDDGELTIIKSKFNKNIVDDFFGGAIYHEKGTLTMSESSLNENIAKLYGGGIYFVEGKLTIIKSKFSKNVVNWEGGAIWCSVNVMDELTKCIFRKNKPNDISSLKL